MKAEMLMDAMNLLPDDLLEETNLQRQMGFLHQKKRFPWKPLAAVAACLCLAVGLWLVFPGETAMDNAMGGTGGTPEMEVHVEHSSASTLPETGTITGHEFSGREYVDVTVVNAFDGYVGVVEGWRQNYAIDGPGTIIALKYLEDIPRLSPGQHLRIYFGDTLEGYLDTSIGDVVFIPQSIEIWSVTP